MLTEKTMHDCLVKLIKSSDEDNLECLCHLMTVIGKDVDHQKNKVTADIFGIWTRMMTMTSLKIQPYSILIAG